MTQEIQGKSKGYTIKIGSFNKKALGYPVVVSMEGAGIHSDSTTYCGICRLSSSIPTNEQISYGSMVLEGNDFTVSVRVVNTPLE